MWSFKQCINEYTSSTLCLQKDINSLVATLDGLKNSFGSNVSGFVELTNQAEADQTEAVELMNQLRNAQQVKT